MGSLSLKIVYCYRKLKMDGDDVRSTHSSADDSIFVKDRTHSAMTQIRTLRSRTINRNSDESTPVQSFTTSELLNEGHQENLSLVGHEYATKDDLETIFVNINDQAQQIQELKNLVYDIKQVSSEARRLKEELVTKENLIEFFKDSIKHLQEEVSSKNKIIDILMSEESLHHADQNIDIQEQNLTNQEETLTHVDTEINNESESHIHQWQEVKQKRCNRRNMLENQWVTDQIVSPNKFEVLRDQTHEVVDIEVNQTQSTFDVTKNSASQMKKRKPGKRSVTVLSDSMAKDIKQHLMRQALDNKVNVYIRANNGATITDMHDLCKPTLRRSPNLAILHVGTNDLRDREKSSTDIAKDILKLAMNIKSAETDIVVSGIVIRTDDEKLNDKGMSVNSILSDLCRTKNVLFIDNANITCRDLNQQGLHLNYHGTKKLADNFLNMISL